MLSVKKSVHITLEILSCNSISAYSHFQYILVNESHSQSSSSSHHRWKLISGLGNGTSHKEPWDNRPETQNRHNDTTNKSCFLIRQTRMISKGKNNKISRSRSFFREDILEKAILRQTESVNSVYLCL